MDSLIQPRLVQTGQDIRHFRSNNHQPYIRGQHNRSGTHCGNYHQGRNFNCDSHCQTSQERAGRRSGQDNIGRKQFQRRSGGKGPHHYPYRQQGMDSYLRPNLVYIEPNIRRSRYYRPDSNRFSQHNRPGTHCQDQLQGRYSYRNSHCQASQEGSRRRRPRR